MVSCTPARWPAAQRRKRVKKRGCMHESTYCAFYSGSLEPIALRYIARSRPTYYSRYYSIWVTTPVQRSMPTRPSKLQLDISARRSPSYSYTMSVP